MMMLESAVCEGDDDAGSTKQRDVALFDQLDVADPYHYITDCEVPEKQN